MPVALSRFVKSEVAIIPLPAICLYELQSEMQLRTNFGSFSPIGPWHSRKLARKPGLEIYAICKTTPWFRGYWILKFSDSLDLAKNCLDPNGSGTRPQLLAFSLQSKSRIDLFLHEILRSIHGLPMNRIADVAKVRQG